MASQLSDCSPGSPALPRADWRKLVLIWLVAAAFLALVAWPALATFSTQDPDDSMRLLQVRDWLDGQGWYDTRQYRFDPPHGADMHWVRLVDLPIGFFLLIFKLFLGQRAAETATMAVVPLLQLLLAMRLQAAVVRQLGGSSAAQLVAAAIIPAFPLLLTNFVPTRLDHHGWQALAALAVAWCLLKDSWRHALLAGLTTAGWLIISLEGMFVAAVFGAMFALRYVLWGKRHHEAYLLGLAAALPALFLVFRPPAEFVRAYCDLPSWPHFLAFGAAAALAALSRFLPAQDGPVGRGLSLLPIVAAASAALIAPLGWCVVSPFQLDPYLERFWLSNISESAPLTKQAVSVAAMTVWTLLLAFIGGWSAWRTAADEQLRTRRSLLAASAIGAGVFSVLVMRAGLVAQMLTLPLVSLLIVRFWPRARGLKSPVTRILATLALIGFATPMFASAATKRLDRGSTLTAIQVPTKFAGKSCRFDRLNALPPSHMFVTIDRGPELLARTRHTAVMSGYHRNQKKMIEVIKGFAAPLPEAEAIIRANHADYVVACVRSPDLWVAAKAGRDNLADRIIEDRVPAWLEPVPGYETSPLRVFKVR